MNDTANFHARHRRTVTYTADDDGIWIECACGARLSMGQEPSLADVVRAGARVHDDDPNYMKEWRDSAERIRIDDVKRRFAYELRSRNLEYGVYDGIGNFIGIREKLGDRYLDSELHWDRGGTARPTRELVQLPDELALNTAYDHKALFTWLDELKRGESR